MAEKRFHSVVLDEEKCKGCTNCIKGCPTEAIRVREGKASIDTERCIDCGECIRRCPNHAKIAVTEGLSQISTYRYKVAMPAPALYAQFGRDITVEQILNALLDIGFDDVIEVAYGADVTSFATREFLKDEGEFPRPLISSACPAVVRLIQVRFPNLVPHLTPIQSPMDIAAGLLKRGFARRLDLGEEEIGAFFITPCPAKAITVRHPLGLDRSYVDGTVSIAEIYGDLLEAVRSPSGNSSAVRESTGDGIGWARSGGENQALGMDNHFAVDGIHHVIDVLEEVEMGKLDVDYIEALSCVNGCVGGPLTVENPFVARRRIRQVAEPASASGGVAEARYEELMHLFRQGSFHLDRGIEPQDVFGLDRELRRAIDKMEELENTIENLPGLDCGSCGAPTCNALAEDIVKGLAQETDCVFKLREEVKDLAERLLELATMVPPAMGQK